LLGLTWAGLAPADRASFAGAFPLPTLRRSLYRSVGEPRLSVRCDTSAAANVCCVLLAVNRCRANNLRTLCIMKEPIRESTTITNGTYAVQKIASMNHELLFVSTRLGGAEMFVGQEDTDAAETASGTLFWTRELPKFERVTRPSGCGIHRRALPH
jgi:hypothetical protein